MKKNILVRSLAGLMGVSLFWLLAVGCDDGGTVRRVNYVPVPVKTGFLQKGITITADDGSFVLEGGRQFNTPFSLFLWNASPDFLKGRLSSRYRAALLHGARRVRIKVGNINLFGVLLFTKVNQFAKGPGARSYLIKIPVSLISRADNGDITVAYETAKWNAGSYYTWVLWMSSTPF